MIVKIIKKSTGDFAILKLVKNEEMSAEAGILVAMSCGVEVVTEPRKGLLKGLRRLIMGGENFFINKYRAVLDETEIVIAPNENGEIEELEIDGSFYLQSKSFLASIGDLETDINWNQARNFYANEGMFLLKLDGKGKIIFSSNGAMHKKILQNGEKYKVSTGHVVGFNGEIKYEAGIIPGGIKEALFGASTIVAEFEGPGELYIQASGKIEKSDRGIKSRTEE